MASYLLKKADNDNVRLLGIRGTGRETDLRQSLVEMSLTSELTKSDKGLYHVQICPAYGEDKGMTDEDWVRAADILEQEAGYQDQKRAIVLHDKNGKVHAHVVWERYDHDKGIMKPNKFSRLAQDRARQIMEKEFGHARTPERNAHQPEMKQYLTDIWNQSENAEMFLAAIGEKGYTVAAGTQRPYMVIDETGRSFDLVRQLKGVRTKDVRERFKTTKLVKEKEAIASYRKSPPMKKATKKDMAMSVSFTIQSSQMDQKDRLPSIVEEMDSKEVRKKQMLNKLKRERLQKAREFRENERDL